MPELMIPDASGGAAHPVTVDDPGAGQFANRLRKVARERRKWARREGVSCYRVYDADLPDFAIAVDLYLGAGPCEGERYAVVAEYRAPGEVDAARAEARLADAVAIVSPVLDVPADHVFVRQRRRDKGGAQYAPGGRESTVAYTMESGYRMELDLSGYLDTGIFLDHRLTREMVGRMARGKRFLNLFAYTGTATVHAAGGGAAATVTVDMSGTYLDWARRNMAANGFDGPIHRFVRADATEWVLRVGDALAGKFDLVFVDPPTFSNSKAMGRRTWSVQRDHAALLRAVAALLSDGGSIVFSCNLRDFKIDRAGLESAGLSVRDMTAQTIPRDFERNPKIHRCYLLHKK